MDNAEKKWEDHCKKVFYLGPPEERIVAMAILKDFKQALREAIEELKGLNNRDRLIRNDIQKAINEAYETVLEEMNTVTPK